jgi:RNA polymerase sigma factor (TIGR02999 family)
LASTPAETFRLLARAGDETDSGREARDQLFVTVYDELRQLAGALMKRERAEHTLRPTAIVHEAYLKLIGQNEIHWESRAHFFRIAARAIRQVLVDHAREKAALKRGGGRTRITLDDDVAGDCGLVHEMIGLNMAIEKLNGLNERVAQLVELKIFAGLEMADVAKVMGVSKRTVEGDWTFAKVWLARELRGSA